MKGNKQMCFDLASFNETINPCRVPPNYRFLEPDEFIEPDDIYWHNLDLRWHKQPFPLSNPCQVKIIGLSYARKI